MTDEDLSEPSLRLAQIWRYPVKSLGGELLPTAALDRPHGIAGDRRWAIKDGVTGLIASAKHDSRLLYAWAQTGADGAVSVGIPGRADAVAIDVADQALSAWLDRRVQTVAWGNDEGSPGFDFGFPLDTTTHSFGDSGDVLHLITTATLDWFADLAGDGATREEAIRRTRPNLVVDAGSDAHIEQTWVGRELVTESAAFDVLAPTGRCVMVERGQPGFTSRTGLLDELIERRDGHLGVYVTIRRGNAVQPGPLTVRDGLSA